MKTSDEINKIAAAMAKAQGAIETASKDKKNPHFKSSYADLASVWGACRAPLSANELAVFQTTEQDEGGVNVITRLVHSSGQWIESLTPIRGVKQDMQGLGSGITYARRYGLMGIAGISPDDDDGNAAVANGNGEGNFARAPKQAPPQEKPIEMIARIEAVGDDDATPDANLAALMAVWKDVYPHLTQAPDSVLQKATAAKDRKKAQFEAPPTPEAEPASPETLSFALDDAQAALEGIDNAEDVARFLADHEAILAQAAHEQPDRHSQIMALVNDKEADPL